MVQQAEAIATRVGLFLNPVGQRRAEFQRVCGEQFTRLYIADGTEQAATLLAQEHIDLLIIDLERFECSLDCAAIGALVQQHAGASTLVLCPQTSCGWVPALIPFGRFEYAIGPLVDDSLRELVAAQFLLRARLPAAATARETELRALLDLRERVQQVLADSDDIHTLAEHLCVALCSMAGVTHAALFDYLLGGKK